MSSERSSFSVPSAALNVTKVPAAPSPSASTALRSWPAKSACCSCVAFSTSALSFGEVAPGVLAGLEVELPGTQPLLLDPVVDRRRSRPSRSSRPRRGRGGALAISSGRRRSTASGPSATTLSSCLTATGVPRSGPYSRRSTKKASFGNSREAISSSLTQRKSLPVRSRLPSRSCRRCFLLWSGCPGSGIGSRPTTSPSRTVPSFELQLLQLLGPEEGEAVDQDHEDEARDHEHADAEGAAREPDHRVAAAEGLGEGAHQMAR